MADNNRNQSDQYNQDWFDNSNQWNRERRNRNHDEYGDQGNANRTNYDRNESGSNYGSMSADRHRQFGEGDRRNEQNWQNSGSYGNSNDENKWQRNRGNYQGSNQDDFARQYGQTGSYDNRNYYQGQGQDSQNRNAGERWDQYERKSEGDRTSGSHRGKGPKDYQRSEKRILEDVCDRLSDDGELDASNIQVHVENNEVILTGTVENRQQKRRAEDLVDSISGVKHVENRLRVGGTGNFDPNQYTGTTDQLGGIGNQSGTTSEIIRNVRNKE